MDDCDGSAGVEMCVVIDTVRGRDAGVGRWQVSRVALVIDIAHGRHSEHILQCDKQLVLRAGDIHRHADT